MSFNHRQQSSNGNHSASRTTTPSPQQPTLEQQQQQSANQKDFYFSDQQQHFHPHPHATRSHAQQPQQVLYQQHLASSMTPPAHSLAAPNPQHSSQLPTSSFTSTPQHLPSTDYATSQLASNPDDQNEEDGMREQDRLLPIANVSRIMKQAVPPSAKISKDAKDTVQECVSEFIAFITSEASERCAAEKRKTVNGEDIVWAMEQLGFDQYAHLMKLYLLRYRDATKTSSEGPGKTKTTVHESPQLISSLPPNMLFDQGNSNMSLLPLQPPPPQ